MKSTWSDTDAAAAVERYRKEGIREDLALRVYTSRLLGRDRALVLHGGGNTSVKTTIEDIGGTVEVLCVKGSGWDMAEIEPAGLPAVRLQPLLGLEALDTLSDEDMVRLQRRNLLEPSAPTPSVETLLHAFLPHKFIDHTHANAVLAISDQPDGERICADLYGDRAAVLPFVMPGFELAKACAESWRNNTHVEGLILAKHGIFSFGETAREAYERMIALVDLAEQHIAKGGKPSFVQVTLPDALAAVGDVAPILRGRLALPAAIGATRKRMVLEFRTGREILDYVGGEALEDYGTRGTVTPDHVIRTKGRPLIVPAPQAGHLDSFTAALDTELSRYSDDYNAYFARNNTRLGGIKTALDPVPRVVLVPGLGLFASGASAAQAAIAADLTEATIGVVRDAEAIGRFQPLEADQLFDMEYWSLEQAKLGKGSEKPLARHVVAITGAAGAIGLATARAFHDAGAEIALMDLAGDKLAAAAEATGGFAVPCDVTDDSSVTAAFATIAERFGGLDILVSNAGAAWQGRIGEVADDVLRASFDLNFWGHQRTAQRALQIMKAQGTGGCLLFNVSKQAINPGPDFGPYGIPKAATLALMRQYAVDHGRDNIRSNAVNADRIRSGLLSDDMIAARSKARRLSEDDYMAGNLLGREVLDRDVAAAFVDLALAPATTGAVLTVDGGNVAAMMR